MKKYGIAVLPGDGVGIETISETVRLLRELQTIVSGFELDFQFHDVSVGQFLKHGHVITDAQYKACEDADAILLGALGTPQGVTQMVTDPSGTEVSGHAMFKLRFGLDLFAGVRPIKLYPNVRSALAGHDAIDFVLVRESTEGLFASYGGGIQLKNQLAADIQIITREGTEKVSRFAFELALSRNGRIADGKKVVTCTQKANVFRSFAFFKKVFGEVAKGYAGRVEEDYALIDAITLYLLQHPENFDVIVSENAHGDILSDMTAAFVGGMGMAPSGDIGLEHAMFQPAHGTAPTIAGKGVVNPTAAILSGRMMLEWLGQRHGDNALLAAASRLEKGVHETFRAGFLTDDLGGGTSTKDFADEVLRNIRH
jgi:3-isopropylmalate dehydrogenase